MEQSTVKNGLDRLQKNFGRSYGGEAIRLMVDELRGEPDSSMKPAIDKLLLESSSLPSPSRLIAAVREFASLSREQEAKHGKEQESGISGVRAVTDYGRTAIQLSIAHLSGKMSKREYLKACFANMERHNVQDAELMVYIETEWQTLPPEEVAA